MSDGEKVRSFRISRRGVFVGISLALFLISLVLHCFYIDRPDPAAWAPGIALLLVGWLGMFDGIFAWLANPLLLLAWTAIWFPRLRFASFACALLALLFALSFLLHDDIMADEGGGRAAITEYSWGYWIWLSSISTMVIGGAAVERKTRRVTKLSR